MTGQIPGAEDAARFSVRVEREQLRSFVAVIGALDARYRDVPAARAAGHPDLLVPPTFLFGLELAHWAAPFSGGGAMGTVRSIVHVEQRFTYHAPAFAGDLLAFSSRTLRTREVRRGAMRLVDRHTRVTRGEDEPIADLHQVLGLVGDESAT